MTQNNHNILGLSHYLKHNFNIILLLFPITWHQWHSVLSSPEKKHGVVLPLPPYLKVNRLEQNVYKVAVTLPCTKQNTTERIKSTFPSFKRSTCFDFPNGRILLPVWYDKKSGRCFPPLLQTSSFFFVALLTKEEHVGVLLLCRITHERSPILARHKM